MEGICLIYGSVHIVKLCPVHEMCIPPRQFYLKGISRNKQIFKFPLFVPHGEIFFEFMKQSAIFF